MKDVAVYETKTHFSELLTAREQGGQFVIMRRGEAAPRLISAAPSAARRSQALAQKQRVSEAFDALGRD